MSKISGIGFYVGQFHLDFPFGTALYMQKNDLFLKPLQRTGALRSGTWEAENDPGRPL